jgi:peptidoglycan/xylan/chitin deacetylase (PgdA/CDA1 family)
MSSTRERLKLTLAELLDGSGIGPLITRLRPRPRVLLLGYHRIVDAVDPDGPTPPALCVSTETLRRQLDEVRARFEIVPLAEAVAALSGRRALTRDACAITFDDAYRDVILRALPVLASLGVPGAVFVPTGYAGASARLPHDRLYSACSAARRRQVAITDAPVDAGLRPQLARAAAAGSLTAVVGALIATMPAARLDRLNDALEVLLGGPVPLDEGSAVMHPDELRALARAGWEIGAHTVGHVALVHEDAARVHDELARPRVALARWTGRPCRYFAYCNGLSSPSLVTAVRRAGYEAAVTTCDRPNLPGADLFRLGRKQLSEAHGRGGDGRWSPALAVAHLNDLFGSLGLTRPVDGEHLGGA